MYMHVCTQHSICKSYSMPNMLLNKILHGLTCHINSPRHYVLEFTSEGIFFFLQLFSCYKTDFSMYYNELSCQYPQTKRQLARNISVFKAWSSNNIITKTHFLSCNIKEEVIPGLISYSLPLMSEHLVSDHQWSLHNCCSPYHPDHQKIHLGWSPGACRVSPPAALHPSADQQLFKVARPPASSLCTGNQRNHTPEITSICMIIWESHLGFGVSVEFSGKKVSDWLVI